MSSHKRDLDSLDKVFTVAIEVGIELFEVESEKGLVERSEEHWADLEKVCKMCKVITSSGEFFYVLPQVLTEMTEVMIRRKPLIKNMIERKLQQSTVITLD